MVKAWLHAVLKSRRGLVLVVGLLLLFALLTGEFLKHVSVTASPKAAPDSAVSQLWLGRLPSSCASTPSTPGIDRLTRLEACTSRLTLADQGRLSHLEPVAISPQQRPSTLGQSIYLGLRPRGETMRAVDQDQPLLFGFQLPLKTFRSRAEQDAVNRLHLGDLHGQWLCYGGRCYDTDSDHAAVTLDEARLPVKTEWIDVWVIADHTAFLKSPSTMNGYVVASSSEHVPWSSDAGAGLKVFAGASFGLLLVYAACALILAGFLGDVHIYAAFALICISRFLLANVLELGSQQTIAAPDWLRSPSLPVLCSSTLLGSLLILSNFAVDARWTWRQWFSAFALASFMTAVFCYYSGTDQERVDQCLFIVFSTCVALPAAIVWHQLYKESQRNSKNVRDPDWSGGRLSVDMAYLLALGGALALVATPDLLARLTGLQGSEGWRYLTSLAMFPLFFVLVADAWRRRRKLQAVVTSTALLKSRRDAINEMIQMVAHDTRKPFSLLRTGAALLKRAKSPAEIDQVVTTVVTEVERAIRSVNAMLEDIMTVSSEPKLVADAVFVDAIVSIGIHRVFTAFPDAESELSYRFEHRSALYIDSIKILRVLTSILENALRATKSKCRIWFHTSEGMEGSRAWITLTIGNSGSFIPADKCAHIFDAYFVEGHASGASLSLAVARTFVELHQGTITCTSQEGYGTEFIIKLPTALHQLPREPGISLPFLPAHSRLISERIRHITAKVGVISGDELTPREMAARTHIRSAVQALGRPLRVLLIDDEPIYTAALSALLDQIAEPFDGGPTSLLDVHAVTNPSDAMKALAAGAVDLAIVDVDLGSLSFDGLTLIKRYKNQGLMHFVCVHSNRSFPADYKRAIDGGADSFLPKPMSRSHLFEVVQSAATVAKSFQAETYEQTVTTPWRRPHLIVVVDDDIFVREAWEMTLSPEPCLTFADASGVLEWIQANPAEVKKVGCFVLDLYFDGHADGFKLADDIRAQCSVPILLSSDAKVNLSIHPAIDAVIAKEPINLEKLLVQVDQSAKQPN